MEQYHEERDGTRVSILLGEYDAEEHRQWIARVREREREMGILIVTCILLQAPLHRVGSVHLYHVLFQNPEKAYRPGRRQVSHFYSGGTVCDVTGRHRQVEVKLKCKESNR